MRKLSAFIFTKASNRSSSRLLSSFKIFFDNYKRAGVDFHIGVHASNLFLLLHTSSHVVMARRILLVIYIFMKVTDCTFYNRVPFRMSAAAYDILGYLFEMELVEEILGHGCWCAKLDPGGKRTDLGGKVTVDGLDHICKKWFLSRACTKQIGNYARFIRF